MKTSSLVLVLLLGTLIGGCRHVAPYERGTLARPDMTTADVAGPAAHHVNQVHEGALPSGSIAASGCGCN